MSLADGLAYSRNTITAQVMQKVGPARVARLARDLGVRDSKLDAVPSLALGTSPVSLKEMVTAYASIADGGRYLEPVIVTQVEDRQGHVLQAFAPGKPKRALDAGVDLVLLDAMRGVVDRGTGRAVRDRYGITADVAGKTGTTQDNTDGWFLLMHPQLVAGAWVGFDDSRLRMGDSWGPGASSALPMVAEFFQMALGTRSIDPAASFGRPASAAPPVVPAPNTAIAGAGPQPPQGLAQRGDAEDDEDADAEPAPRRGHGHGHHAGHHRHHGHHHHGHGHGRRWTLFRILVG
jgi:penicillin-binding protein 1A